MRTGVVSVVALLLGCALAGCSKSTPEAQPHKDAPVTGDHGHVAPHGGSLIELGEEAFHLELVRDRDAGKLTAYVLDAHAENFIRIPATEIPLTLTAAGERRPLPLRAVANAMTGETVGSTSQFEAETPAAKTPGELRGEIGPIEIRGGKFGPLAFALK